MTAKVLRCFLGLALTLLSPLLIAGQPLWTFTPLTATTITVPQNGTATIQYTVTNQSNKSHTLMVQPVNGITQIVGGPGICGTTFNLPIKGSSCTLSLLVTGSQLTNNVIKGPVVCQLNSNQCYTPSQANSLNITIGSPIPQTPPTLTSINPISGTASGGAQVTITGANLTGTTAITLGGSAATGINVINSTTVSAVTTAHAAGVVDVVVTTPGGSATLTDGYTYNTTAVGQSSQGGTIACLGGAPFQNLIASVADNSPLMAWGTVGITTGATSASDGATNTTLIVNTLGAGNYAALLCENYSVDSAGNSPCQVGNICYNSGWFLPSLNQLNCLYNNAVAIGGFNDSPLGVYWSSTEINTTDAWTIVIASGQQVNWTKNIPFNVRCVRSFTP